MNLLALHHGQNAQNSSDKTRMEVEHVSKRRGDNIVLQDVSVSLRSGEIVVLVGPSGSGKTTLAEIISGVLVPDAGHVFVDGRDVTGLAPHQRRIPIAPQDWDLFPNLTALQNVEFGLRVAGVDRVRRKWKARELLAAIGVEDRLDAYPHQLSGGQQQRVSFARALAVPSPFLILDEPFANVDQDTRSDLRALLSTTRAEGRGVLLITHDRVDALQMADRTYCLIGGRVAMSGSPEEVYQQPNTLDVALLTGDAFLLPTKCDPTTQRRPLCQLILRPEWLNTVSLGTDAQWEGIVESALFQGDHYLITFRTDSTQGQIRSTSSIGIGQKIGIAVADGITPPCVPIGDLS
jgi:ABC-type Fe3+/spermidine/putrescine transport system ATPase subunit